ncbi:MAG: uracil-DNA glycosylase, partial [Planctomyces sp.]|nr:uracil-DNA glycosylase [Planctomyces sp.]
GLRKSAADCLPEVRTLQNLRAQAAVCTGCELHGPATQTVFGTGSEHARLAFVGEQPGDEEDLAGEPFVGPAGRLLREMMQQANVDPSEVYLTNTVKHFKYVQTGPRRLHKKPGSREITACKPWLEAELQYLKPAGLLLLGVTSAQAVLGRDFRLSDQRGKVIESRWCRHTIATWHPAAILRAPTPARQKEMQLQLLEDIGRGAAVDMQK